MAQRSTKQRQIVLETVTQHHDHPTADQIYQDVQEIDPRIGRGTVYRNLNVLEGQNLVRQVRVPDANRFDYRCDRHYHLICTECGKVVDAPLEYQQSYDETVAKLSGFKITEHQALVEGICPECQKALSQQ